MISWRGSAPALVARTLAVVGSSVAVNPNQVTPGQAHGGRHHDDYSEARRGEESPGFDHRILTFRASRTSFPDSYGSLCGTRGCGFQRLNNNRTRTRATRAALADLQGTREAGTSTY